MNETRKNLSVAPCWIRLWDQPSSTWSALLDMRPAQLNLESSAGNEASPILPGALCWVWGQPNSTWRALVDMRPAQLYLERSAGYEASPILPGALCWVWGLPNSTWSALLDMRPAQLYLECSAGYETCPTLPGELCWVWGQPNSTWRALLGMRPAQFYLESSAGYEASPTLPGELCWVWGRPSWFCHTPAWLATNTDHPATIINLFSQNFPFFSFIYTGIRLAEFTWDTMCMMSPFLKGNPASLHGIYLKKKKKTSIWNGNN